MKEKTYRKMTKKRFLRGLRLFNSKYLTKERFYALLAKLCLVIEVKDNSRFPIRHELLNSVKLVEEKLVTDRGVFKLSYLAEGERIINSLWYRSISNPKKKLLVVRDENTIIIKAKVISQCEEFEVRLDPFNHLRLNSRQNKVSILPPQKISLCSPVEGEIEKMKYTVKEYGLDFLNARVSVEVSVSASSAESSVADLIKECISKARAQVQDFIESSAEEINERISGVKYDGEFVSPDGQRLLENCLCRKCGLPVFKSSVEGYSAYCVACHKNLHQDKVAKVDQKKYEVVYDNCKMVMYHLLTDE